jgi:RNA polymerase sigma-70 factor, ECF subfamily
VGLENVMELQTSLARLFAEKKSRLVRYGLINGVPGFVSIEQDDILQTTALEIENDKIVAIYVRGIPTKCGT